MELGNELEAPCKVMVLMSTYNGQRYLQEQLDSIYRQRMSFVLYMYVTTARQMVHAIFWNGSRSVGL